MSNKSIYLKPEYKLECTYNKQEPNEESNVDYVIKITVYINDISTSELFIISYCTIEQQLIDNNINIIFSNCNGGTFLNLQNNIFTISLSTHGRMDGSFEHTTNFILSDSERNQFFTELLNIQKYAENKN